MPLVIVNRDPDTAPLPSGGPVWRTCLREVAFTEEASDAAADVSFANGQRFVEGDAYRTLLEILCGLRSPMVGETQVLGQFKAFLGALDGQHGWINRVGQRLLTDARAVRATHLQGLGSRSYGSAIRRHLDGCELAVLVGTGKLAHEVMPFLSGAAARVDHWGRSADGAIADASTATYRTLDQLEALPAATGVAVIVIAAPVSSDTLIELVAKYPHAQRVIDLRAETGGAPLDVPVPVVALQQLFDEMQDSQTSAAPRIQAARAAIAALGRQYELREEPRPFGWEDVCA